MTQHRTAARRVVVSLSCFAYHKMLRLLPNRGLVGSQGLKRTMKKIRPTSTLAPEFTSKWRFPTWAPLPTRKKLAFLQIQSSNFALQPSIFKLLSLNSIFKLHSSNSIFKLQSPRFFRQIVQFQVIKNLLKKSKIK